MEQQEAAEAVPERLELLGRLHAAAGVFQRLYDTGFLLARPGAVPDQAAAALERLRTVVLELARDGALSVAGSQDQLIDVRKRCGHEDWRQHVVPFITRGLARPLRLLSAGPPAEPLTPQAIDTETGEQLQDRLLIGRDLAVRVLTVALLMRTRPEDPLTREARAMDRLRQVLEELAQDLRNATAGTVEEVAGAYARRWTEAWAEATREFVVAGTPRPARMVPPLPLH